MKRIIDVSAVFVVLCSICTCFSQEPPPAWQQVMHRFDEICYTETETNDGGLVVTGDIMPIANGMPFMAKFRADGSLEWSKGYETSSCNGIYFGLIKIQTSQGEFYVSAGERTCGGVSDGEIMTFDREGTPVWVRNFGGSSSESVHNIMSMFPSHDALAGGFIIAAGYTLSYGSGGYDQYVVKFDTGGSLISSKTIGGAGSDFCESLVGTTDGGLVLGGSTNSFGMGNYDIFIVKLDTGGTVQWSRTIGGQDMDDGWSIIQTTEGGFIIAGGTKSFGAGNFDVYIVKLSASGTLQWTRTVGTPYDEVARCIIQTPDGGFAACGISWTSTGNEEMFIVKLDAGGAFQWAKTLGGNGAEGGLSLIKKTDGSYIAGGYSTSFGGGFDMYFAKFNSSWNTCGNTTTVSCSSGTGGTMTSPSPIVTSPVSNVTTPSITVSTGGTLSPVCVIGIQPNSNEIPASFQLYQNYPNPFNPSTKIHFDVSPISGRNGHVSLVIYDMTGREIETLVNEELKPGTYEVDWNASGYSSGVYFYHLTAGELSTGSGRSFAETKKMVLIK